MSKTFQKFEILKLKAFIEQESFEVVRVDNVIDAKENLQNIVNVIKHGKMLTRNQIRQAIDVIQDIKLREGIEFSVTEQRISQLLEENLDFTKPLIINHENQTLVHLSKLYSMDSQLKAENKAAQKRLQKSYSSLITLAQLIISNTQFRSLVEALFFLFRDLFNINNVPDTKRPLSDDESLIKTSKAKSKKQYRNQIDTNEAKVHVRRNQQSSSKKKLSSTERHSRISKDLTVNIIQDTNHTSSKRKHVRLTSDLTGITIQAIDTKNKSIYFQDTEENADQVINGSSKKPSYSKEQAKLFKNEFKNTSTKTKSNPQDKNKRYCKKDAIVSIKLEKEELQLLTDRFLNIIREVQSHPEYRKALQGFFDVLYHNKSNTKTANSNSLTTIKGEGDVYLEELLYKAKKTVEKFAGDYSLDSLASLMKESNDIIESDPKLQKLMYSNYKFILSSFKSKSFIQNDKFKENTFSKFQSTRRYILKYYTGPLKRVLTEGTTFFDALRDPLSNRNIDTLENLSKELFLDNTGLPTIKFDMLQDFHKFIPILANRLRRLEIPCISRENDGIEYILDNILLNCDNILPENVQIHTDAAFNSEQDRIMNVFSLKVQNIQASAQKITFYFKKKILIGNIEDTGTINLTIGKGGLDIFLKVSPKPTDKRSRAFNSGQPRFTVIDSKCKVNNIEVNFQHGKYDLFYKLFNKNIQKAVKHQIEMIISQGIRNFLEGNDNSRFSQALNRSLFSMDQLDNPFDLGPDGWKGKPLNIRT